jgi:hypothetical protein
MYPPPKKIRGKKTLRKKKDLMMDLAIALIGVTDLFENMNLILLGASFEKGETRPYVVERCTRSQSRESATRTTSKSSERKEVERCGSERDREWVEVLIEGRVRERQSSWRVCVEREMSEFDW